MRPGYEMEKSHEDGERGIEERQVQLYQEFSPCRHVVPIRCHHFVCLGLVDVSSERLKDSRVLIVTT